MFLSFHYGTVFLHNWGILRKYIYVFAVGCFSLFEQLMNLKQEFDGYVIKCQQVKIHPLHTHAHARAHTTTTSNQTKKTNFILWEFHLYISYIIFLRNPLVSRVSFVLFVFVVFFFSHIFLFNNKIRAREFQFRENLRTWLKLLTNVDSITVHQCFQQLRAAKVQSLAQIIYWKFQNISIFVPFENTSTTKPIPWSCIQHRVTAYKGNPISPSIRIPLHYSKQL